MAHVSKDRIISIIRVKLITLRTSMFQLLITAKVVLSTPIFVTLMMEAIGSSGTLVLTRTKWRNIPEYGSLQHVSCASFC
jgi:hypothetical protein